VAQDPLDRFFGAAGARVDGEHSGRRRIEGQGRDLFPGREHEPLDVGPPLRHAPAVFLRITFRAERGREPRPQQGLLDRVDPDVDGGQAPE
jgi:hypothetical protein